MKFNGINKGNHYSKLMIGILAVFASYEAYACGPTNCCIPPKIYLGAFGGWGSSSKIDISQYGTAFYTEINGGPLAVNAFGKTNNPSVGLFGAHVGYQWMEIFPNRCNTLWGLTPAVEWEGYSLGRRSFTTHDINNDTVRLNEHDFLVTFPMKTGVFLTNAVLNLNFTCLNWFHPYVGAGFGAAVISISNATAEQVAPPEPGINHYNSNPSDTEATFAAQTKAGLSFDLCKHLSVFVEYRWLYLSNSNYAFGSTDYAGHPPTSNWQVRMDSQSYNLGTIGLQVSI